MKTFLFTILMLTALGRFAPAQDDAAAQVAQAKANEQRVRDNLRSVTQQLRQAEAEKATLLAGQTERDQKIADLESRLGQLAKQGQEEKAAADKSLVEVRRAVLQGEQEVARLGMALDKWKAAYHQAAAVAKKTEAARALLDAANISLERRADERERQNLALYKTGKDILQRYADFSLGRAIAAREPFTGLAKARLEEQVQDYADKLEDSKLKPTPSNGKPATKPTPVKSDAPIAPAASPPSSKPRHF